MRSADRSDQTRREGKKKRLGNAKFVAEGFRLSLSLLNLPPSFIREITFSFYQNKLSYFYFKTAALFSRWISVSEIAWLSGVSQGRLVNVMSSGVVIP